MAVARTAPLELAFLLGELGRTSLRGSGECGDCCRAAGNASVELVAVKNRAAVALGRRGGRARAKKLSKKERKEIARLGGLARQRKRKGEKC